MPPVDATRKIPRIDFELSPACDHSCAHCYNVWNAEEGDPQEGYSLQTQLKTLGLKRLMTKAIDQTGAEHITLTGGEPLIRKDSLDLVDHACQLVPSVTLITNGSHVPPENAARIAKAGVRSVQLTLLSADRDLHDRLKGAVCFDDTVRAALDLREAGVHVQVCYVAMSENAGHLRDVLELCWVLGVTQLSYNRMSPTGGAIHHIARLMPTIDQIEADLEIANTLAQKYKMNIGTAMPIPPCLVRIDRYPHVDFGYCSTGTHSPNIVVDGAGNVRSCNLASGMMGNLLQQDWAEIYPAPYQEHFAKNVPDMCKGCPFERSCQGGCKESGFATFGDHTHPEPLIWLHQNPQLREELPVAQHPTPPPVVKVN